MRRGWSTAWIVLTIVFASCGEGQVPSGALEQPSASPATQAETPEPSPPPSDAGEPVVTRAPDAAPDFTIATFDGGTFALREQTGMPVVINFFDSW